jgi:palmitoyltransferase
MTTNESQKWADLREDMADGYVFKASRESLRTHLRLRKYASNGSTSAILNLENVREESSWPVESDQVVLRAEDGRPPPGEEALWVQVWSLGDIVNIYDLGGWDNFMDVLKGR